MASIAAEPQRLIAVSLGKIAASRSQRGGINLHKNLLVASVLHKARTAYMMENFQQMLAAKRAQAEQNNAQSPVPEKTGANPHETTCHEAHVTRSQSNPTSPRLSDSSDKENTPPRGESSAPSEKMETQEKTLSPMSDSSRNTLDSSVSVNQQGRLDCVSKTRDTTSCLLKRRRSNASQDMDTVLAKKAKYSDNVESDSHCEPMQTEPTQITNLVSIFNTGFGGLCSTGNGDLQLGFSRSDSLHCSAQVEKRVGLPTVIALTV
ncbi:immediate early response gene 5-like protein [Haliotis cracherodii]|uniref:immediate early response gene 5-like protein n=1 Tax=Haliotis rufescens TaxID=6454 RepID=UPI001EAFFE44|nr:immediate early response gene 5-like protein [Haliotis rufescens]